MRKSVVIHNKIVHQIDPEQLKIALQEETLWLCTHDHVSVDKTVDVYHVKERPAG